jgi:hypothetical protein
MQEMSKHGRVGLAAMKAGMDRKTAHKYIDSNKLPSEMEEARRWRTRVDPFERDWSELKERLADSPELQAKTLFDDLLSRRPERYAAGQLRTLQRRIEQWRAQQGPEQAVVLTQRHRPGEAGQLDFTTTNELEVTIRGERLLAMLCVFVLPFSNWTWATVCVSESLAALRRGLQTALFQLGCIPRYLQTDNSTAATHKIPEGEKAYCEATDAERKRPFNAGYLKVTEHFGLIPRTTQVGAKEQNGDVEAANGALKRRLHQALLLRGSRDFDSVQAWQTFVDDVNRKANASRSKRVTEEMTHMRELHVNKLVEYEEFECRVSERGTIRVKYNTYSVPSRLRGHKLRIRLFEDHVEAYFKDQLELSCGRLVGRGQHRVDYRHVIWSLVRKPGGFERYSYREEMFPSLVFRQAYDIIQTPHQGVKGDLEYLRILHLAASTMEADVEAALALLLEAGSPINSDGIKALVNESLKPTVPQMDPFKADLNEYNDLLEMEVAT